MSMDQALELRCMDPDNYRNFFGSLYWSSDNRRIERKGKLAGVKKDKPRKLKTSSTYCLNQYKNFCLLSNPSQFEVYAAVRKSVLTRWKFLLDSSADSVDDNDHDDGSSPSLAIKISKVTSIGLCSVFALISHARLSNNELCEHALKALLDVLQGHAPGELIHEPDEIICNLQSILVELCGSNERKSRNEIPSILKNLSSSCLIALAVARGETELVLETVATLVMPHPKSSDQVIQVPSNVTTLQNSVQSAILGSPSKKLWKNYGVPHQSLVSSFPVDLPFQLGTRHEELVVRSMVSDGCFLYIYCSKGLLKIGSGYGSSIRQHVYLYNPNFFSSERHGWLGFCKNNLYLRIGRKNTDVYEIDVESLDVRNVINLDPGEPNPIEPKSAIFTDSNQLGLIVLTDNESLTIRMYNVDLLSSKRSEGVILLKSNREINVPLLRRGTMVFGKAPFDEIHMLAQRPDGLEIPLAVQLEDNDEDPLISICSGLEFGLLTTSHGKVYYTGKAQSLGYKVPNPTSGKWHLMTETLLNRNELRRKRKVIQVAVGHEGVHAILVLDSGDALFTGVARRCEDGDTTKHRRMPKPTKPKRFPKMEAHHIVYAACNYGSTALVTKQGLLFMFGKDTQHCDANGLVTALADVKVVQVALGKAHAVALTNNGQVFTFGINNKGQCGRELGYTKEKIIPSRRHARQEPESRICHITQHVWTAGYCKICVLCCECTGFSRACRCTDNPNRMPKEQCGCGKGDSGCSVCGICRRCAATSGPAEKLETDDEDKAPPSYNDQEMAGSSADCDRESNTKLTSLVPALVAIPGGHKVAGIAAGLHHTVLLTDQGEVLAFGSNQSGQLGAGDISVHNRIIKVRMPKAQSVAAGSNHTAVLTRDGDLFTFGSNQKGALGRARADEPSRHHDSRHSYWYATPGRIPCLGAKHSCKAVWVTASGDQTFVQVSQALIKMDSLFSATIAANNNSIVILPNRPEHTFKCVTINRHDNTCNSWTGPEQVDFVNTLACLDPLYDLIWCYQPSMRVIKCYNILVFDPHVLQKCCVNQDLPSPSNYDCDDDYPNFGTMKSVEEFKNLESMQVAGCSEDRTVDGVALTNMSVLNPELAIPCVQGCYLTRMHVVLHLLGCLDSLSYAHDNKISLCQCKQDDLLCPTTSIKDDFLTVNRFETHGGGWGYSGYSVEAIRFMCDTEILLGGYGLYGGRGDYIAKIKLYDIGPDGGDLEGDGDLVAESDDVMYECAPRDKHPVLFEMPVTIVPNRWYVAWVTINGPSSDCGSLGLPMVLNDEIGFHFKSSKKSNNGTDVNAGQIPCLLYNIVHPDHITQKLKQEEPEPVISKNISRKLTVPSFKAIIKLISCSWTAYQICLMDTNGHVPINYQKLKLMKHQKRLVYIVKSCLRLLKSYINEIYPQDNEKKISNDYMSYFDAIAEVRKLVQSIMAAETPHCGMLLKQPGSNNVQRICYVQFALDMTNSILKECHETLSSCFHAFFPTPILKWNHLCFLLSDVNNGVVPAKQIRELTSTCGALCVSRSLRDVLQYVVPLTQRAVPVNEGRRPECKLVVKSAVPLKSATVPRSKPQQPPPIPPRTGNRDSQSKMSETSQKKYTEWHLLDVLQRLLDIVILPIKTKMMTIQCGQAHDHGELKQQERFSKYCCKLVARIIGELANGATVVKDDTEISNASQHITTPVRFMRVIHNRTWNTENGSPDAICFTVDRSVSLVGICVFAGSGNYEYEMELLHDMRPCADDSNTSHCWLSLEMAHGTYVCPDAHHDMIQLKFNRPIAIKEGFQYAIRLCNNGARTANGDCGLPSIQGSDGTTFKFSSCSLSYNGTSLARGQIPSLIYCSSSKQSFGLFDPDNLMPVLRSLTVRLGSMIIERATELFCSLRNELTAEDLRRNANVLQQSAVINILLPYVLASLEGLDDAKSVVQLLEMVHYLLPHVAAVNLLLPSNEETQYSTPVTGGSYYAWAESDHPYKEAAVTNIRVLFPSNISWIVLEMDPRSITAQPEDGLTIYSAANAPKQRCHCATNRSRKSPFKKRVIQLNDGIGDIEDFYDVFDDNQCLHYNCTYAAITQKLANVASEWPRNAILVPGHEVVFSLETATDYLDAYNRPSSEEKYFGFRCLCVGYEDAPFTSQRQGLLALEMELTHSGASSAARLLAPDLEILMVSQAIVLDVQRFSNGSTVNPDADDSTSDYNEALVISRGLDLSTPPSVHQILEGQPLMRSMTAERQFLLDFVAGTESTAGERLFRWLSPASYVDPAKSELQAPSSLPRPGQLVTLPVLLRDQHGDIVVSPAITIEVMVQRIEEGPKRVQISLADITHVTLPDAPYQPPVRDILRFQAISMMRVYSGFSFEELRYWSGEYENSQCATAIVSDGRLPTERLTVRCLPDGTFTASWTPKTVGQYKVRCVLDDLPISKELILDVTEVTATDVSNAAKADIPTVISDKVGLVARVCQFVLKNTAGLRIRSSPSLQAEAYGKVPKGASVTFIEEITNKDGTWVRLSSESISLYSDGCSGVAWCLQYDQHHARTLLKVYTEQQQEEAAAKPLSSTRDVEHSDTSPPTRPVSSAPRKVALSPAQIDCLRSLFACLLWHEGIVHDAIACASFLKFHPQLSKQGIKVATRRGHDIKQYRPQRHSIEVSTAGQYLRNEAATHETLSRSDQEPRASGSQTVTYDMPPPISEEDPHSVSEENSQGVAFVNVLPPALRALVALWDSLIDSEQLAAATNKGGDGATGPKKKVSSPSRLSYMRCEICGSNKIRPIYNPQPKTIQEAVNMAFGTSSSSSMPDPVEEIQPSNSRNMFCPECRDKANKSKKPIPVDLGYQPLDPMPEVDHHIMKENAMFLLDLAPINVSEPISQSPTPDPGTKGPCTQVSSIWQPAPPFQSLAAWGAQPNNSMHNETAKYHSLGRAQAIMVNLETSVAGVDQYTSTPLYYNRVPRSVSMGNTAGRDLLNASQTQASDSESTSNECDTLTGAGMSLLSQPSAALQRLAGCGEWNSVSAFETPRLNSEEIIKRPAIAFTLFKRELHTYRQRLDAVIRINTIRQYAFEALNWLLRSATQPTCVHDVMWWFCNVLATYSNIIPVPSVDNNKQALPYQLPVPSTASLCPGGQSAGARPAFHAFLGSVSSLAASLPNPSAAALQAVRCWAMNYSRDDRAFLHRSQVFSVISKILSHSEDQAGFDNVFAIQESAHSYRRKDCFTYSCPDITAWCDITASSHNPNIASLVDGSTETFWESGDEDRNRSKWIQVTCSCSDDRPYMVCLHLDNTRDTHHKVLMVSFTYGTGTDEMVHLQDSEVDPNNATWAIFCIPKGQNSPIRVRCELRGPEQAVRVRQLRVLCVPGAVTPPSPSCAATILHKRTDVDTLKVFRLLTSQVFDKLLEWGRNNGSDLMDSSAEDRVQDVDDSDLREHLVGILFAGHKLTSLQKAVMSHIVEAIGSEATHARDDWETALFCDATVADAATLVKSPSEQDGYCFEMLSLLLAISGSAVGRAHLANRTGLLRDLLSLLHTGSERVQRQVIALLRRMIAEIPPQKMFTVINFTSNPDSRLTILDHLICYLGKAITIQVKVKGSGGISTSSVMMGTCLRTSPNTEWFMRGHTTKKHAQMVAKLLSDMAENKVSPAWADDTKQALANYIFRLTQIEEPDRHSAACTSAATMWQALAALCVCEEAYMDVVKHGPNHERSRDSVASINSRTYCANHDDGTTLAIIECTTCGPLCGDCDRILHLNKASRTHQRSICKEEETSIRIDIHEGCGRAKLFWLLLLVDRRTLKGLAEFRNVEESAVGPDSSGYPGLAGTCRYCGTRSATGLLAIGNVCADLQCQEHVKSSCVKVLSCGHYCGGVRGEATCLPCLFGCAGVSDQPLLQDADDMCMICFTDPLQAAPSLQLRCGHLFHLHCCQSVLKNKWNGPRITFSFSQCPICKESMAHWALDDLLAPIRRLRDEVKRKAILRLEYEGLEAPEARSKSHADPVQYAMERYAYYVCHKCGKAFFGGLARCEAEMVGSWEPSELVCGPCSDVTGTRSCPRHGTDFLEYKCRYCCSVAVYFCFGTSHFCNACHDEFQRITSIPRHELPQCPAGPKGEQLPGTCEECPLHVSHAPTGEEFALGCGICRRSHVF